MYSLENVDAQENLCFARFLFRFHHRSKLSCFTMHSSSWILVALLASSCNCVPMHKWLATVKPSEPSLELTLATKPSSSSRSELNLGNARSGSREKTTQGSKSTQLERSPVQDDAIDEAQGRNWLSLWHSPSKDIVSSTTSLQAVTTSTKGGKSSPSILPQLSKYQPKEPGNLRGERERLTKNREAFWKSWNDLGLSKNMKPNDLAKAVRGIQMEGGYPKAGVWVKEHLSKDHDYLMEYVAAQRILTDRLSQLKHRKLRLDADFRDLPAIEQDRIILNRLIEIDTKKTVARKQSNRGPKYEAKLEKEYEMVAKVGSIFEKHFQQLQIDPTKLALSLHLQMKDIRPQRFQLLLNKYLKQRGLMERGPYRYLRGKHHQQKNNQGKRNKRQAQADNRKGKSIEDI
jgi:hypothetical protein